VPQVSRLTVAEDAQDVRGSLGAGLGSHARKGHPATDSLSSAPDATPESSWSRMAKRVSTGRVLVASDVVISVAFILWWKHATWPLSAGSMLVVLAYASAGLYRHRLHLALLDQLPRLLSRFVIAMTIAATVPVLLGVGLEPRPYAAGAGLLFAALVTARGGIFAIIRFGRSAGVVAHPTVLVGDGESAHKVAGLLNRHKVYGLKVIGYVAERPSLVEATDAWHYLGGYDQLSAVVRARRIEVLILDESSSHRWGLLDGLRDGPTAPSVFVMPRRWHMGSPRATDDHIGAVPIQRLYPQWSPAQRFGKRLFDVVLATVGVLALSPLLVLVALAIVCEDGHGPLFRQVRVGRNGRLFTMYKFRSMRPAAAETSDTAWSGESESRIGRVGRFIRATSIDELPQLFNILRGDMTFVGPRPERPHYVRQFSAMFPDYESRHRVAVGLTGLAQVSGLRGDTSIGDRVRYDNYYIDHWSLWFDIKVLIWTLGQTLGARGS
jgi:exopolysaccharide biosynthesis polyprenyl glycosylphosphotransferase